VSTLTEISGGSGLVVAGLSVSLPGYTLLDSLSPYTSATGGHHRGMLKSWGRLSYAISDRGGTLPSVELTIRGWDTDRSMARIKEGTRADEVRGSAVTAYLMAPGTASSGWNTVFTGILTRLAFPEPFVYEITARVNDQQLSRIQPDGWKLTAAQWPNADPAVFDSYAPTVYGVHDASYTSTGPGMLPTLYVDKIGFRYLVAAGKLKSVDRVYVDGVQTGSGWSTSYVTVSGRIYTLIDFTTDQGTAEITCDANGYESVGDGSGSTITNPATQWAHRLSNFILGDYMTGSWLSTSVLIDSTALSAEESYWTSLGARGSDYNAGKETGVEITTEYCNSWRRRCAWTASGKIAIGGENLFASPYGGTRLRWYKDEIGAFNLVERDFTVMSRLAVRQTPSAAQGSFLSAFSVVDASVSSDTPGSLDLTLSEAK